MTKYPTFYSLLEYVEQQAWLLIVAVINEFLGCNKEGYHENLVKDMLALFQRLGINMSSKINLLDSQMSFSPENLGTLLMKQTSVFIKAFLSGGESLPGRCDITMLSNYCGFLMDEDEKHQTPRSEKILKT